MFKNFLKHEGEKYFPEAEKFFGAVAMSSLEMTEKSKILEGERENVECMYVCVYIYMCVCVYYLAPPPWLFSAYPESAHCAKKLILALKHYSTRRLSINQI